MIRNRFIFQSIFLIILTSVIVILVSKIQESSNINSWPSLVPPLIAILLSWICREPIIALFLGVWIGAWIKSGGIFKGLIGTFDTHILCSLTLCSNPDFDITIEADTILPQYKNLSTILLTLMIGGMIGIIQRNGGVMGMVNLIFPWINSAKRAQLVTSALGIFIFFDDYVNTLFLGTSMKSIIHRQGISREKLAYIIDSTAAPVACLAPISTWIGYELTQIRYIPGIDRLNQSEYVIFINSIYYYSFYPFLAIFFVFCVAWTQRDFGPMFRTERRHYIEFPINNTSSENAINPNPEIPSWRAATNAILPLIALLGTTLIGLYITGSAKAGAEAEFQQIIVEADPYKALKYGAGIGVFVAFTLTLIQRIMPLQDVLEAWLTGVKFMIKPVTLLLLALALANVMKDLGTSEFLKSILEESVGADELFPLLPTFVFIISGIIAFASGSSWTAMAILFPIIHIPDLSLTPENQQVLYATISSVLAGAVWGDHCSPVSDTTILSATVSECDHMSHVDTQLPYALLVGGVAIVCTIMAGFGRPSLESLIIGCSVLLIVLLRVGRNPRAS